MVRVVLGDGSPSRITLFILKNNCTKFGAFVCFVPKSSKFTTKQPDYISLGTLVPNSRDRQGKLWLPKKQKNGSENNLTIAFLSNTSHKSLSTELLAP